MDDRELFDDFGITDVVILTVAVVRWWNELQWLDFHRDNVRSVVEFLGLSIICIIESDG